MAPLMRWLKRVVDRVLGQVLGWPDLQFSWSDSTEQDPEKQAQIAVALVGAGIATRNEARATIGLPPLPVGDALTTLGPVTPLAQTLRDEGLAKAEDDWDSDLHPRWPQGAPDSQGGRFAPKGDGTTIGTAASGPGAGDEARVVSFTDHMGSTGATEQDAGPAPIPPGSLPARKLTQEEFETAAARNRYLARKYDRDILLDHVFNLFTGAMSDPANVLTPEEKAEHTALTARLLAELYGPPPSAEVARLIEMESSPIGAAASVISGLLGFDQKAQDLALGLGSAAEGIATAVAGGPAQSGEFLNTQRASGPRGIFFVPENLGPGTTPAQRAARDFDAGTEGAFSDVETRQRMVPAMLYANPKSKGLDYVKFDGMSVRPDGTIELIDRKTNIIAIQTADGLKAPASLVAQLQRQSNALVQNPGYAIVLELPNQAAADKAQAVLEEFGIKYISARVHDPG
jgi:hypothetical protein